mgnify:CR=1 FL=1
MNTLQNIDIISSFISQSFSSKFPFLILFFISIYILWEKSHDKIWKIFSLISSILSFYAALIVPILNWKSGVYKCMVKGEGMPREVWNFCRERMYEWYGENLWQWIFAIAILLIFIGYFYISRDKY